jgi:hypothetical protein
MRGLRVVDAPARRLLEFSRTKVLSQRLYLHLSSVKRERFVDSGSSDGFLGSWKNIGKSAPNARRDQR